MDFITLQNIWVHEPDLSWLLYNNIWHTLTIVPTQSQSQRKEAEAFAHHIHFHLKNYACSVGENGEGSEAFFTLYDADENKCIR